MSEPAPVHLVTAAEMRGVDRRATESFGLSLETLMENAGAGAVEVMEERYGDLFGYRALVLCGRGHNGGDGLVAARHLLRRGVRVETLVAARRDELEGQVLENAKLVEATGAGVRYLAAAGELRAAVDGASFDFAVDALLGTGARPGLSGVHAEAVRVLLERRAGGASVVALDLPTGLDADTGSVAEPCVRADLTVTFAYPKRGHALYPGRERCGSVVVVDIGIPSEAARAEGCRVEWMTSEAAARLVPRRPPTAHKGSVGKGVVIGGSRGLTGAVCLTADAALSAGLGMVYVATAASLHDVIETKLTEPITWPLPEGEPGSLGPDALGPLLEHLTGLAAAALGPGLGRTGGAANLAMRFLAACRLPTVVDADGLFTLARTADWWRGQAGPRVVTPHVVEMSRLTGLAPGALEARRIEAAREWSERWGAVVVLKGAPTVTAAPDGRATVNATGNPGMASAGMGDVLTGAILAFLGQGLAAYDAARLGAFLHGLAGDRVAERQGIEIVKASEVEAELRPALAAIVAEGGSRDGSD